VLQEGAALAEEDEQIKNPWKTTASFSQAPGPFYRRFDGYSESISRIAGNLKRVDVLLLF
jgi:hypothetical protein